MQTSLIELHLACYNVIFSPSESSLSDGKHASLMDPSDNLNFKRLGQSLRSRLAPPPPQNKLNLACHDVIFSPSDNSLSDGKHACPMDPSDNLTFRRLGQSPWSRFAHASNLIKPCLS